MANLTTIWTPCAGAGNEGVDYLSADGQKAIEAKSGVRAFRDLQMAALRVAAWLAARPNRARATLVLDRPVMSLSRIQREWAAMIALFRPEIESRLNLIVVEGESVWCAEPEPEAAGIVEHVRAARHGSTLSVTQRRRGLQLGAKHFEVVKILIDRWLLREGPTRVAELADSAGCSYPTVQVALKYPLLRKSLRVASNRSVELRAFPFAAWKELRVRDNALYPAVRFQDRSGDAQDPASLLRRLEKLSPANVAVGGVLAARHWDPGLDLHGVPRLDLVCHVPDGELDLGFVQALDPALNVNDDPTDSAALVVHPLFRTASRFASTQELRLPLSAPVETALHLLDMGLDAQAQGMINHLREEARLL